MKSWEPQSEFERADFPRKKKPETRAASASQSAPETGREVKVWRPRSAAEASAQPQRPAQTSSNAKPAEPRVFKPAERPGGAAVFLGQAIAANLEEAAALLRSLYWDKKDTAIGGKRRIKVILSYAGPSALKALRSVLTPMERAQFAELARTEAPVDAALTEEICREFTVRLRHMHG